MSSAVLSTQRAVSTGPRRNGSPGELRLTRRGRLAILSTVVVGALAVFAQQSAPAESASVVHHPRLATVVVAPGQTVWDIARSVSRDADPRQVVAEIEELNSLSDAGSIRVGQPLFVPTR